MEYRAPDSSSECKENISIYARNVSTGGDGAQEMIHRFSQLNIVN